MKKTSCEDEHEFKKNLAQLDISPTFTIHNSSYVFFRCLSVHGGRCTPAKQTPLGRYPPGQTLPTPEMATAVDAMPRTGMHFCWVFFIDFYFTYPMQMLQQPPKIFYNLSRQNEIHHACAGLALKCARF